jgi:arylsulfatase
MAADDSEVGGSAYQGYLQENISTVADVFRTEGSYQTYMMGKWHVGGEYPPHLVPEHASNLQHPLPVQREFNQHYGTLGGAGSYYDPHSLDPLSRARQNSASYTDAINDCACEAIRQASNHTEESPFFSMLLIWHPTGHSMLHPRLLPNIVVGTKLAGTIYDLPGDC